MHGRRHRALMRRKPEGGEGRRRRHRDNAVDSGQELPGVDEATRVNNDDDDADALYRTQCKLRPTFEFQRG